VNLAYKAAIGILFYLFLVSNCLGQTGKSDSWFGKDKLEHFTVSAFYTGGIAVAANKHFDLKKDKSIVWGVGITISLGAGKEIYDRSKPNETSSIKDFIWDIAGAITGAVIAGSII